MLLAGLVFIVFSGCLSSCSPRMNIPYTRTGEVEMVESDASTLTVTTVGYARTSGQAIVFAEQNALENILFRGIPGSIQENPMIQDEEMAFRSHGPVLEDLIQGEKYRQFVIQSYTDDEQKGSKGIRVDRVVKFDIGALRKYLERNGVVRKFGL